MATDELLGGRYRIDRVAGHGGMATVFEAYDSVLERKVAIKLLQRSRDPSGIVRERFRREALAEARIVHPNVVAVHDVGFHDDGRPYIVMDFVDGESLGSIIGRGALGSERVAFIGLALARALAVAHDLGIVHRDVKPQNILIDAQGLPQLADFGLAQILGEESLDVAGPGSLLGTALYVAPEQARYGTCTPQADLYSLGAVLYHALAGAPPFAGDGAIDVAQRRFDADPPLLSARVPAVDLELAGLVHALLARDPASRPAGAGGVAERMTDIAARMRTERNAGESPAPAAVPVSTTSVEPQQPGAVAAVPLPNSSLLPGTPMIPVAHEPPDRATLKSGPLADDGT